MGGVEFPPGGRLANSQGQAGTHGSNHKRTRNTVIDTAERRISVSCGGKTAAGRGGNSGNGERRTRRGRQRQTRAIFRKHPNGAGFFEWRSDSPFVASVPWTTAFSDQRSHEKRSCLSGNEIQDLLQRQRVCRIGIHGSVARILGHAISVKRNCRKSFQCRKTCRAGST